MLVANEEVYGSVTSVTIDDAVSSAGWVTNAVPGFGFQSEGDGFCLYNSQHLLVVSLPPASLPSLTLVVLEEVSASSLLSPEAGSVVFDVPEAAIVAVIVSEEREGGPNCLFLRISPGETSTFLLLLLNSCLSSQSRVMPIPIAIPSSSAPLDPAEERLLHLSEPV